MNFIFTIAITVITISTARDASLSDESIENILYYKDCSRKAKQEPKREPMRLEDTTKQPECIPRMCCSMSCDNKCGQDQSMISRQMSPNQPILPAQPAPMQPQIPFNQRQRKKKQMQTPVDGRKNMGFTREHIKSLISEDQDIKKILKDLVRVAMQKVDLIDMINSRRSGGKMVHPNFITENSQEDDE